MKYRTNRRKFLETLGLGLISSSLPRKKFSDSGSHEQPVTLHAHQTGLLDRFRNIPVTDCHFHINGSLDSIDYILNLDNILDACSVDKVSILATSARLGNLNRNMILAIAKAAFPSRVYAGGGLVYHYPATDPKYLDLREQARTLANLGFDVFKMIEGKPEVRKELGHPLGEARNFGRGAPLEFWPVHKMIAMRTFLETDEAFRGWHYDLRGIQLPDEVLVKIYHENFYHLAGRQDDRAIEACNRIVHLAERYAVIHDIVNEARNCIRWLNSIQFT